MVNKRTLAGFLILTIIASALIQLTTQNPAVEIAYAGGEPPKINNVSLNRENLYRGLQTLAVVANVTDDDTEPAQLKVAIEIVFADGLTLRKDLTFLREAQLFDVRIPIPSSAAVGSAVVRIKASDRDGLESSYETTIGILSDKLYNELKASVENGLTQFKVALTLVESMGINASEARTYLEQAEKLSEEARVRVEVLEDVDTAIELYQQAAEALAAGLTRLTDLTSIAFKSIDSLQAIKTNLEITATLTSIVEGMGLDVSRAKQLLEEATETIRKALESHQKAEYEQTIILVEDASRRIEAALEELKVAVEANTEIQRELWRLTMRHAEALDRYTDVAAYISSLKALGVDVSEAEANLRYAADILDAVRETLSQGKTAGVDEALNEAIGSIEKAENTAVNRARGYAERNLNTVKDLAERIEAKILKPDLTYLNSLIQLGETALNNGKYLLSISYTTQAIGEAARLLKVASDQELALVIALIAVAAAIVSMIILLAVARRRA